MAQLSRPFQVALAAVVVLAAVWVVALRGHSNSPSSPAAPVPSASSAAPSGASASSGGGSSPIYHGSAPGVEGLTRAVAKAHEAVATSEHNASQLAQKSEQASAAAAVTPTTSSPSQQSQPQPTAPAKSSAAPIAPGKHASKTRSPAATKPATKPAGSTTSTKPSAKSPAAGTHNSLPARQRATEAALAKGQVAVLLFWDAHGADDVADHRAVQSLRGQHGVFVSEAGANQVAEYGSITRGIQVYGTPTILILAKSGQTITLTGLQDAYAISQAIQEARHS